MLVACDSDIVDPGTHSPALKAAGLAAAQLTAAVSGRTARGFEDDLLRLDAAIDGFGGMFRTAEGRVVAYLPDTALQSRARVVLARNDSLFSADDRVRSDVREGRVHFLPGRFRFSELVAWQQLILRGLPPSALQTVDADESANRVNIGLARGTDRKGIHRALAALGVPTEAVHIEYDDRITLTTDLRDFWPSYTGGGIQIMNNNAPGDMRVCTLGFNVTSGDFDEGFLTAAHCGPQAPWSGATNFSIYQPVGYPAYNQDMNLGSIHINPLWTRTDAECLGLKRCTWADVMFVKYDATKLYRTRRAVFTTATLGQNNSLGSTASAQRRDTLREVVSFPGLVVDKTGRTTGWTRGTVQATCVAITLNYNIPEDARVLCADRVVGSAVGDGDSGGPVWIPGAPGGSASRAVGVLFARQIRVGQDQVHDNMVSCYTPQTQCTYWFANWRAIEAHLGKPMYSLAR